MGNRQIWDPRSSNLLPSSNHLTWGNKQPLNVSLVFKKVLSVTCGVMRVGSGQCNTSNNYMLQGDAPRI